MPLLTRVVKRLLEHAGGDHRMAALGNTKTPGAIVVVVYAYLRAFRNSAAAIKNGPDNGTAVMDFALRQHQRVNDAGIRMYLTI